MWLPPALLLLSLPGCFSIHGPKLVRGPEGGSLTVECHYKRGWESNKKWWCRGQDWDLCKILIQTTSKKQKMEKPRLHITDNRRDRVISVTMKGLRRDDEDTYWCGINRIGTDRGAPIKVIIDPENTVPGTSNNDTGVSSGSRFRNYYLLLVYVKVPILLLVVGAVLWLKGPPRVPEEQWEQPVYMKFSYEPTEDTAP